MRYDQRVVLTLSIREILPATPRAKVVRLDLGAHEFCYEAGQAVQVGSHGGPLRKPYSIAASPADAIRDRCLEFLVGLDESGEAGPHLDLELGAQVDVDGPTGTFTFPVTPESSRFLFVAGGTGIAPLRAMLRHAVQRGYRDIGLFYSARTPTEFAYESELDELAKSGTIELKQTITRGDHETWRGGRGRISESDLAPLVHDPRTLCFVCGPPSLVDDIPRMLTALGIARERIKIEEWS